MLMNNNKSLKLSQENICVSIGNVDFDTLNIILDDCSFAEIRLDLLKFDPTLLFNRDKPLIATFRKGNESEEQRVKVLSEAMRRGATYIDLDISDDQRLLTALKKSAQETGSKIILSYHNYTETPPLKELRGIELLYKDLGADLVKIACKVNAVDDLLRLYQMYNDNTNIISFGMGQLGVISRVNAPILGAPFTYAYHKLSKPTADGQIEIEKLIEIYKALDYIDA